MYACMYISNTDVQAAGPAAAGIGSGAPPPAAAAAQPGVPEGFLYDEASGWYYSSATGYYFDAGSQTYYEPNAGTYFRFDFTTGQHVAVDAAGVSFGQVWSGVAVWLCGCVVWLCAKMEGVHTSVNPCVHLSFIYPAISVSV